MVHGIHGSFPVDPARFNILMSGTLLSNMHKFDSNVVFTACQRTNPMLPYRHSILTIPVLHSLLEHLHEALLVLVFAEKDHIHPVRALMIP